ncbi:MAG TPA: hypothetical protein VFV38_41290 [Ktedonobacteraceae bacterium]|nr:hypothetical protein [Ktedonobacteraceae bacterium]
MQNEAVWMATLVLSRGVAVPVAVHEAKNGWNVVPSKPLQAPEMLIFTAEYLHCGKRTQNASEASPFRNNLGGLLAKIFPFIV